MHTRTCTCTCTRIPDNGVLVAKSGQQHVQHLFNHLWNINIIIVVIIIPSTSTAMCFGLAMAASLRRSLCLVQRKLGATDRVVECSIRVRTRTRSRIHAGVHVHIGVVRSSMVETAC